MAARAEGELGLEVRLALADQRLRLEYRAINSGGRPLFVFNILHGEMDESGVFPLLHDAYVEMRDNTVVVSRKLFPIPPMMFVERRNIPFATRLLPGQVLHEVIELAVPLKPNDPYHDVDAAELRQWMELPLIFELGYFPGAENTEQTARTFPTDHGLRAGFDVFTESAQLFQRAGPLGTVPIVVASPVAAAAE